MMKDIVLWRRLDAEGHEACRLMRRDGGWRLDGTAVFQQERSPACLSYEVDCDDEWLTQWGAVYGWIGGRSLDFRIARSADRTWTLNGQVVPQLDECVDLDLGFTPATNLSQLRRVALQVGEAADIPVAWLDVEAGTLDQLDQRYERRSENTYWYEAPRFNYSALLQVSAAGFVERYPSLWEKLP